jgi:hypothetical protein
MTIQEITDIIKKQVETYKISSDNFVSAYNRELELTKEYNGRQILELLQNADDAQSDAILIKLDTNQKTLLVCNKGDKPFETDGIKSLMIANLSNKTKKEYIGNKGLGFRSILNWANEIKIESGGCKIVFSAAIAKNTFEKKLGLTDDQQKQIIQSRGLTDKVVPFPILGIPNAEKIAQNAIWTTIIEISYKEEFETDIKKQINKFRKEILLFLNHIQQITIQIDDFETIHECKKEPSNNYEIAVIDKRQWNIYTTENELPLEYQDKNKAEKQCYKVKIAFQDDPSNKDGKLYNYFPTQHTISLPCIIHGTFDLDSSRNHLNDTEVNKYILQKTIELLKTSSKYFTNNGINWNAYKFLTPKNINSDSDLIKEFYNEQIKERDKLTIFPCINNQYCKKGEFIFYSNDFNSFFQNDFPDIFPDLLIPIPDDASIESRTYDEKELVEKINQLSSGVRLTINLRAKPIKLLVDYAKGSSVKYGLLINEQNDVIQKETTAFTPSEARNFKIPDFVKIDFLNKELYSELLKQFEIKSPNEQDNQRELQRKTKNIVNILPYDKNNIANKIISETNTIIKTDEMQKIK